MTDEANRLETDIAAALQRGDIAAAEWALDRLIELSPRHVFALILKGDCRAGQGDTRAATAFYQAAVRTAEAGGPIDADTAAAVRQARDKIAALADRFEDELRSRLAAHGPVSPRIAEAMDLLAGRRELYHQQPQSFYYPGLPQLRFYERDRFEWVRAMEEQTGAIRSELQAILSDPEDAFRPYVESEPGRPPKRNAMVGDRRWSAYYLWQGGEPVAGQAERCPATMAALRLAPIPRIAGRSPMALFSQLRPGMHILPHSGFLNTRLICHLPLIVPPGCRLRVGNETREWATGEMLIFDDSIEHEAWNDGSDTRIVLLFEIWRPEIDEADRIALTTLFEAVSLYKD